MPIRCVLQIEEVSQPLHDLGQSVIIDVPDPIAEPFGADGSWLFGDGKAVVEFRDAGEADVVRPAA